MSARDIVGGIAGLAVSAMKHPVSTAEKMIGQGKRTVAGAAGLIYTTVEQAEEKVRPRQAESVRTSAPPQPAAGQPMTESAEPAQAADSARPTESTPGRTTRRTASPTAKPEGKKAPAKKPAARKATGTAPAKKTGTKKVAAKKGPTQKSIADQGDAMEKYPPTVPEQPPIPVVEQALAAEEKGEPSNNGHATEPRASSRDEEHGDASLRRSEVNELADEVADALRGDDLEVETPAGTTGADVGYNPDTAEADLQQPGTPPLVDPSLVNEVGSEQEQLSRGADPDKG